MTKLAIYFLNLVLRCHHDQILERAAGLTYRILLAFFPFIIFLVSLLGMLHVDESALLEGLFFALPMEIANFVRGFLQELSKSKTAGLMSTALFFTLYNTSNGFRAIIRMTNRAYGMDERWRLAYQIGLSFLLMLLFAGAIVIMLAFLVFGRQLLGVFFPKGNEMLHAVAAAGGALVVLTLVTMIIYKLACGAPLRLRHVLPGAIFAVAAWMVASGGFGFVISNFTQLPVVYGSVAGVFILILWLNTVSIVLLIGNEANVLLREYFP